MSEQIYIRSAGNPWTPRFLVVTVIASVLVTVAVGARNAVFDPIAAAILLAAAALVVLAWIRFPKHSDSWGILAASAVVAVVGMYRQPWIAADWVLLAASYLIIVLFQIWLRPHRLALPLVASVLFGLLFLNSASLLGNMAWGGFPAVFAFLLTFIIHATHELERRTPVSVESSADPHIHLVHRKALAWISIIFFLLGVTSFWPWLGKIYGNTYVSILAIGVLAPLLYLWERLRQPRRQNSLVALRRFNRVVPYLGLVLLLAIALG